jgi:hypothetical protein
VIVIDRFRRTRYHGYAIDRRGRPGICSRDRLLSRIGSLRRLSRQDPASTYHEERTDRLHLIVSILSYRARWVSFEAWMPRTRCRWQESSLRHARNQSFARRQLWRVKLRCGMKRGSTLSSRRSSRLLVLWSVPKPSDASAAKKRRVESASLIHFTADTRGRELCRSVTGSAGFTKLVAHAEARSSVQRRTSVRRGETVG